MPSSAALRPYTRRCPGPGPRSPSGFTAVPQSTAHGDRCGRLMRPCSIGDLGDLRRRSSRTTRGPRGRARGRPRGGVPPAGLGGGQLERLAAWRAACRGLQQAEPVRERIGFFGGVGQLVDHATPSRTRCGCCRPSATTAPVTAVRGECSETWLGPCHVLEVRRLGDDPRPRSASTPSLTIIGSSTVSRPGSTGRPRRDPTRPGGPLASTPTWTRVDVGRPVVAAAHDRPRGSTPP